MCCCKKVVIERFTFFLYSLRNYGLSVLWVFSIHLILKNHLLHVTFTNQHQFIILVAKKKKKHHLSLVVKRKMFAQKPICPTCPKINRFFFLYPIIFLTFFFLLFNFRVESTLSKTHLLFFFFFFSTLRSKYGKIFLNFF